MDPGTSLSLEHLFIFLPWLLPVSSQTLAKNTFSFVMEPLKKVRIKSEKLKYFPKTQGEILGIEDKEVKRGDD